MTAPRVTYGVWLIAAFVVVALLSLGIGLLTGLAEQQSRQPRCSAAAVSLTPTWSPVTISAWTAT